jgi:hypothetical protein
MRSFSSFKRKKKYVLGSCYTLFQRTLFIPADKPLNQMAGFYEEGAVDLVSTGPGSGSSSHFLTIDTMSSIRRPIRYILLHMKIRISTKKKKLTVQSVRTMSIKTYCGQNKGLTDLTNLPAVLRMKLFILIRPIGR